MAKANEVKRKGMFRKMKVKVKKLKENAKIPFYATELSAGSDFYACIEKPIEIKPGETEMIPTGLAFAIPKGYVGLIYARSGLASKQGLAPANKVGVIDADYRGEVLIALHNHSQEKRTVEPGDRLAQFVITPYLKADYEEVEELDETARKSGGFGSTGK